MFKAINGYTKESIKEKIESDFKGRAVGAYQTCQYKTDDGKKCAVGLFIPESHEGQAFRGGASSLVAFYPDLKETMPLRVAGLEEFQKAHDSDISPSSIDLTVEEQKLALMFWVEANVL